MIWAIKNEERIKAIPKEKAICPLCNQQVISKCGEVKIWHWAHKSNLECDSFKEPETEWHFNWKDLFEKEFQEVVIKEHRADIQNKKGLVIEFQNSPLSSDKINEREVYYTNFSNGMVWILNGDTIADNFGCKNKKKNLYGFRKDATDKSYTRKFFNWKWFPKSWFIADQPIYIDISSWNNDILFKIEKLYEDGKGYGIRVSKSAFIVENGGKPWKH